MVQFRNYVKKYNGNPEPVIVVPELTLGGGIYWLKGENGSGKTTLLRSIAGLIPFEGDIEVGGVNIRKERIHFRKIVNYAEAEPVYPDFLTGADLIDFYHSTKGGSRESMTECIEILGIQKYMNNKVSSYSSGMAKKLSLALAFIGNPRLILLDEPLITLDTGAVQLMQTMINKYHGSGVVFLITSHQEFGRQASLDTYTLLLKDKTISFI
jgi:ABC-2 type transport system ATP-binding protein